MFFHTMCIGALQTLVLCALAICLCLALDRLILVLRWAQIKSRAYITGASTGATDRNSPLPDPEHFSNLYPRVAVQLPMFNEVGLCSEILDCACSLKWPRDRYSVQVLDDSSDKHTRERIDDRIIEWREKGVNVVCLRRFDRNGYKAGALKNGLELLRDFEYIAIFDAGSKPHPNFLVNMIPYIHSKTNVGFAQARWIVANSEESLLTKFQEMRINFHMKVEQYVNSIGGTYFCFNGTAGVWRRKAIEDVGGWSSRTTAEDIDLSLRVYLAGWQAVFVESECVPVVVPSSIYSYYQQQRRRTSGPAQLWTMARSSIFGSKIPWYRRYETNFIFFILRGMLHPVYSLIFLCCLTPLSILLPEMSAPTWSIVYIPFGMALLLALFTKNGWKHSVSFFLLENALSFVKVCAILMGLFHHYRAQEWIVVPKSGVNAGNTRNVQTSISRPFYAEVAIGIGILSSAFWSLISSFQPVLTIFLAVQGTMMLIYGMGLIDPGILRTLGKPRGVLSGSILG